MTTIDLITDWRAALEGESYMSASRVQDRLLGLWGDVGQPGTTLVEEWLTISRHRQLFSVDEIRAFLDQLEAVVGSLSY